MIPDEMVEKAAGAIVERCYGQELPEAPIDLARAALEAVEEDLRADERKSAFDEGMWALGDMIGVDPEWYDRILRPSQET